MDTQKIKNLLTEVKNGTKTEEDATKEIMKDYGIAVSNEQTKTRNVQLQLDNANTKLQEKENEVATLKGNSKEQNDWETKYKNLESTVNAEKEKEKQRQEEEKLTNNIIAAFGDSKFTSDYVKNGLIADIKLELGKDENKGKGIKEIFESLTKDKSGIFENPNKGADMPGMGDVDNTLEVTKEQFDKMGYKERVDLKKRDPNLYEKLK